MTLLIHMRERPPRSGNLVLLLCLLFTAVLVNPSGHLSAQTDTGAVIDVDDSGSIADSLDAYPQKMPGRFRWEDIVNFPGTVVYFPLKLVFKGAENTAAYVDEKKVVKRFADLLTTDDGRRGVRPYYSSRAGGGIKLFQRDLWTEGSKTTLTLAAGLRGRRRYELRMKRVRFPSPAFTSDYRIRYQFLSDEPFYGIGSDTDKSDRSNFANEQLILSASFKRMLSEIWGASVLFGLEQSEIEKGRDTSDPSTTDLYTADGLPGLQRRSRMSEFQLELEGYSPPQPGHPNSGFKILLASSISRQINGDQFGFWKATADISKYIHLFYSRGLVLRMAGEVTEALSDQTVPFYQLSELGRSETIRGFSRGRFRDNDMILGSAEYRYPVWYHTEMAFFIDAGQVSRDIFQDASMNRFRFGYGAGFLLKGIEEADAIISKVEVAKSSEGIRLYFILNPDL